MKVLYHLVLELRKRPSSEHYPDIDAGALSLVDLFLWQLLAIINVIVEDERPMPAPRPIHDMTGDGLIWVYQIVTAPMATVTDRHLDLILMVLEAMAAYWDSDHGQAATDRLQVALDRASRPFAVNGGVHRNAHLVREKIREFESLVKTYSGRYALIASLTPEPLPGATGGGQPPLFPLGPDDDPKTQPFMAEKKHGDDPVMVGGDPDGETLDDADGDPKAIPVEDIPIRKILQHRIPARLLRLGYHGEDSLFECLDGRKSYRLTPETHQEFAANLLYYKDRDIILALVDPANDPLLYELVDKGKTGGRKRKDRQPRRTDQRRNRV